MVKVNKFNQKKLFVNLVLFSTLLVSMFVNLVLFSTLLVSIVLLAVVSLATLHGYKQVNKF